MSNIPRLNNAIGIQDKLKNAYGDINRNTEKTEQNGLHVEFRSRKETRFF